MQNTTAVTDVTALFVGPELLEIPSAAERNGYKKKKATPTPPRPRTRSSPDHGRGPELSPFADGTGSGPHRLRPHQ